MFGDFQTLSLNLICYTSHRQNTFHQPIIGFRFVTPRQPRQIHKPRGRLIHFPLSAAAHQFKHGVCALGVPVSYFFSITAMTSNITLQFPVYSGTSNESHNSPENEVIEPGCFPRETPFSSRRSSIDASVASRFRCFLFSPPWICNTLECSRRMQ